MLNEKQLEKLSREIAYVLRHNPEQYGLMLNDNGWVNTSQLLKALNVKGRNIQPEDLTKLNEAGGKARFELTNNQIRARYGHSTDQTIQHQPQTPPAILYHGTTPEASVNILQTGLTPQKRQTVHLSEDIPTAITVGSRHTNKPVILKIDTTAATNNGTEFYHGSDTTWLSTPIKANAITVQRNITIQNNQTPPGHTQITHNN